jgi:hypothetical protein
VKICYLVLLHQKFDQALRMIRRLAGPDCGFIIHIDASARLSAVQAFRKDLESLPVVYTQRVSSRWGSYRQAMAIMHCIQAAVGRMEPFDRYVLISGQDYPIAPRARLFEFFESNPRAEFIEAFPLDVTEADSAGWTPYYRFRRYHIWIGQRHVALPFVRKPLPPLPIYHGSTWWALTRAALLYVAAQFRSDRSLQSYLQTGFLVDEVYVPTLLMASSFASRIEGSNVTFAQWTPTSGPHPKTLQMGDLEELLSSSKLFARKFDASLDGSLMDELDRLHAN